MPGSPTSPWSPAWPSLSIRRASASRGVGRRNQPLGVKGKWHRSLTFRRQRAHRKADAPPPKGKATARPPPPRVDLLRRRGQRTGAQRPHRSTAARPPQGDARTARGETTGPLPRLDLLRGREKEQKGEGERSWSGASSSSPANSDRRRPPAAGRIPNPRSPHRGGGESRSTGGK